MHKVILFRGGMCGDLVLSMIDKKYVRSLYPLKHDKNRAIMKKFYKYSPTEKKNYLDKMHGHTLSHDTEFCKSIDEEQVIQIVCSSEKLLTLLAKRFWTKNDASGVEHVKSDLNLTQTYKLEDDFRNWQNFYQFKHRFDIKNVFNKNFVSEVDNAFGVKNLAWSHTVHKIWLALQ